MKIIIGINGATGVIYGIRLVQVLTVGKALDLFKIEHRLYKKWPGTGPLV